MNSDNEPPGNSDNEAPGNSDNEAPGNSDNEAPGKEVSGPADASAADGDSERRFFRRVLVATDFSEHGQKALETASSVAQTCDPERLVILHVFDVSGLPIIQSYPYYYGKVNKAMLDEIRKRAEKMLDELAEPYLKKFPQAISRLETGRTPFVILEAARELEADLIIMGVAGIGGGRSGMGSTAMKVIRRSDCPVMVVQHKPTKRRTEGADKDEQAKDSRLARILKRDARKRAKRRNRKGRRRFSFRRRKKTDESDPPMENNGSAPADSGPSLSPDKADGDDPIGGDPPRGP